MQTPTTKDSAHPATQSRPRQRRLEQEPSSLVHDARPNVTPDSPNHLGGTMNTGQVVIATLLVLILLAELGILHA